MQETLPKPKNYRREAARNAKDTTNRVRQEKWFEWCKSFGHQTTLSPKTIGTMEVSPYLLTQLSGQDSREDRSKMASMESGTPI